MKRISQLAILVLLGACSSQPEREPVVPASAASEPLATASTSPASPSIAPGEAAASSRYTSLEKCKLVETGDGEDWSVSRCEGHGGYALRLNYGDAREDLELIRQDKPAKALGLGSGGFNAFGDTLEWRGRGEGEAFQPKALIVRNNVSENPENAAQTTSYLVVVDLVQGCVIAKVAPGAGQNQAARGNADQSGQRCLRETR